MTSSIAAGRAKGFDCVELKRALQDRIEQATRGMGERERREWLRAEADRVWREIAAAMPDISPADGPPAAGPG
ncbi:MAG: hypothetical protein HY744_14490 [Deltaproteobacteria bacterium]|nr:hypothetical protein [Deltaproteobacteria bacterium]